MIRASSSHKICTNRLQFDYGEYDIFMENYKNKVYEKTKDTFKEEKIEKYLSTYGLKNLTEKLIKLSNDKETFENNELPLGAKNYLEELWLENHLGLYDPQLGDENIALIKGKILEEEAISLLSSLFGKDFKKNTERANKGFLSGECDIIFNDSIIDIKIPLSIKSFRKKTKIENEYFWQLISYAYLYEIKHIYISYILMPTPEELLYKQYYNLSDFQLSLVKKTQDEIKLLNINDRIKTFKVLYDISDIEFLKERIEKSETYYNSLNFEKCIKMTLNLNTEISTLIKPGDF